MNRLTTTEAGVLAVNCANCPQNGDCLGTIDCRRVLVKRLAYYEDLEEQGKLLILPEGIKNE